MAISCSVRPDVCPGVCYCLGGKREQIQHHPQNCYLKPRVAAECLLLGNSFKLARTSLEPSRKCWAVVIPCDFVWASQIGFKTHNVILSCSNHVHKFIMKTKHPSFNLWPRSYMSFGAVSLSNYSVKPYK